MPGLVEVRKLFVAASVAVCLVANGEAGERRFADAFATSGTGASSDPWLGWEAAIAADVEVIFIKGHFETPDTEILIPSDTVLRGVDGAIVQWPATRSTIEPMFRIAAGSSHVVISGLQFEPGVTVPPLGLTSGGGDAYVMVGTDGSSDRVHEVVIEDNNFGVARYNTFLFGSHINNVSSVSDLVVRGNRMDTGNGNVAFTTGDESVQYSFERIWIEDNHINYSQSVEDLANAIGFGGLQKTPAVPSTFRQVSIVNNTITNANGTIDVAFPGEDMIVANNNVYSDNIDHFLFISLFNTGAGRIQNLVVSDNTCFSPGPSSDPLKVATPTCRTSVGYSVNATITGNSITDPSHLAGFTVAAAESGVVVGNSVNKTGSTSTSADCYQSSDGEFYLFANNSCLNPAGNAFEITGLVSPGTFDVAILGNVLNTTESAPVAKHFVEFVGTVGDVRIHSNVVRGQNTVSGFLGGTASNISRIGNAESVTDLGWRIGDDLIDDMTGDGLEVDAGALAVADSVTRDAEWDSAAEINAATLDDDFATLTGAEAVSNKDLTATTNSFPLSGALGFFGQASAVTTTYFAPSVGTWSATEGNITLAVPRLRASRLYCKAAVPPTGSSTWTLTLRDDSSDTSVACTIDSTSGGECSDNTSSHTLDEGSYMSLSAVPAGGPTATKIQCLLGAGG